MIEALLLSTALFAQDPLDEYDRLNYELTSCSFEQARGANEAGESTQAMLARVERECRQQREAMRRSFISLLTARGESRANAQAQWDQLQAQTRASLRRAYDRGN